uniref:Uncharacterized protein n=1 Tax=Anguilla anguilla TaxID=7936 RepID=A0A0E9VE41_ANGAN
MKRSVVEICVQFSPRGTGAQSSWIGLNSLLNIEFFSLLTLGEEGPR